MGKAARAIVLEDEKILVMRRIKEGDEYFTLVGGLAGPGETPEQALRREIHEETGLNIIEARLVFIEAEPAPYNEQYIFLCTVSPHAEIVIQEASEEYLGNRLGINTHEPLWVLQTTFTHLPFRTPELQEAIVKSLKHGFPDAAMVL